MEKICIRAFSCGQFFRDRPPSSTRHFSSSKPCAGPSSTSSSSLFEFGWLSAVSLVLLVSYNKGIFLLLSLVRVRSSCYVCLFFVFSLFTFSAFSSCGAAKCQPALLNSCDILQTFKTKQKKKKTLSNEESERQFKQKTCFPPFISTWPRPLFFLKPPQKMVFLVFHWSRMRWRFLDEWLVVNNWRQTQTNCGIEWMNEESVRLLVSNQNGTKPRQIISKVKQDIFFFEGKMQK